MFVTGPNVVKEVLNEDVTADELGGAEVHMKKSGVAQFVYEDEENTVLGVKKLLSYIPANNLENPPIVEGCDSNIDPEPGLRDLVPDDPNKPYDIKEVINKIADKGSFFEVAENFAQNVVVGLARLRGRTIGILANQPKVLAGTLDINSSVKGARFIRYCDAFNIPLLTLVDLPGYLPGIDQEHAGVIRHGAKILYAYSEATVPKVTVILRKAYGGGYIAMGSRHLRSDFVFAWPAAEIAVMGPEGAANIIFRKEIIGAEDPEEMRKLKVDEYKEKFANPYVAAAKGYVDSVIEPEETRKLLLHAIEGSQNKVDKKPIRKHGIPPF